MAKPSEISGEASPLEAARARKTRLINTAAWVALLGNALLAILKIATGIYAESLAVLGDGIDTSVDVLIAVMTLMVAKIISRPADPEHPWGHGRAETVATAFLAFILFFAGAQLMLNSGAQLISGVRRGVPEPIAIIVTLISIAGKILLAWSQYIFGKKADSPMLRANAKNMTGDVVISAGVLVGLGLSIITGIGLIDSLAALLVGIWVIKAAVEIFVEANAELMDGGSGAEFYKSVFEAVHSVPGAGHPHRTRMRRIAGLWDIDIDIEVDPTLTIREAHTIASKVEQAIKERVEGVYDIMVHVEPAGNRENEGYGLQEDHLPQ
ncbi:cation efflux family protein [Treponema primitia ZAS-2]|uniref:Cation efflux family protein n=1 Tax=Treponema primitia (strain ATCC BAA-887 / DSM 12427 / ZAS-2) TaxID=545694 RepID=F5YMJ0_TREPZ|nr:cation diffusion facilitator family transporter [Treponema primitia]AEF86710.1 cation efflux family protein [Treponema primitia ZAS-2]